MKVTARAHSNIAFIKYWGRKDELLRLPTNGSISMNLSNLFTTTTVEFLKELNEDYILVNGEMDSVINQRIVKHLDRIRAKAKTSLRAKVISQNSFPIGTGLSSSASGFAALTLAATKSLGLDLSEKELSILARQGSGSASRSIPDGFVEWMDGKTSETSFSQTIFSENYWDIVDIVVVVSKEKKELPSSEGQKRVESSIFFQTRLAHIQNKIIICKNLIKEKNFSEFGKLIEMEALELHAIMLTSWPPLMYWLPQSIYVMKSVHKWRQEGLEVYFTVNTGQDIHIICQKNDEIAVINKIKELKNIVKIIPNLPSKGSYLITNNLIKASVSVLP